MYTKQELTEAVKNSYNFAQVLRFLNRKITGTAYKCLKQNILLYNIDISHFCKVKQTQNCKRKTYLEILIYNVNSKSRVTNKLLKRALIESGREYKCEVCKNKDIWLNKKLVLEIHHKDGNFKNNLSSNLQFLCPNCHSQTEFYKNQPIKYKCICGKPKTKKAKLCASCAGRNRIRTSKIPVSKETLEKLLWLKPTMHIAKDYNVSDNSIAKLAKKYNLKKPPRGYWTKIKYKK